MKKLPLTSAFILSLVVTAPSQVFLNELLFNPVGTDGPNEYFELRGTSGLSLAGYYLLGVEGDIASNPGDVQNIFDLGTFSLGANGYLVGFQKGTLYTGVSPSANSFVNAGTGAGWGSGASSDIGHSADSGATDAENASATYMLVNIGAGAAPILTLDLDADDNGTIELPTGWSILDSVGVTDAATDISYGAITFRATGLGVASGTIVDLTYGTGSYFLARKGDSIGSTVDDWVEGSTSGTAPGFTFHATEVTDPSFAGRPLSEMGLGSTNPVPEPSTFVMGGLGLAALIFLRRRK